MCSVIILARRYVIIPQFNDFLKAPDQVPGHYSELVHNLM
jgi:hypothetical protein